MGDYLEEGVLGQNRNPSHTDWSRPAVALCAATWLGGFVTYSTVDWDVPLSVKIVLVGAAGLALGLGLYRWGTRYSARRQADHEARVRASHEAEKTRQLEEARASGQLDRWKR